MVGIGFLAFLFSALGLWLVRGGRGLDRSRRFTWWTYVFGALPFLANTAGWLFTEMGRQPWIVQGLLLTRNAVSPTNSAFAVGLTLAVFAALYGVLAGVEGWLMVRAIKSGPDEEYGVVPGTRRYRRSLLMMLATAGYFNLESLWFLLIAVLWMGYFLLEGFDFGVGLLYPFLGRDNAERRAYLGTILPVWDGYEVWVLAAGGATFAAFPGWYASLFSGFYLALFGILLSLIVRGVAIEYRNKHAGESAGGAAGTSCCRWPAG